MENKKDTVGTVEKGDITSQNRERIFPTRFKGEDAAKLLLVASTSVFSGFCNAAIGAGGGIVLTFALSALFSSAFSDRREILATTQAAMIPGCLLSSLIYAFRGSLDTSDFAVFAIPALLGGAIGILLLSRIRPGWINGIFSILVIFSGFRMVA